MIQIGSQLDNGNSMQLGDLVKPLEKMTNEELIEHLRQVKQRRSVERPAHRAHVERAEKKTSRAKSKKVSTAFGNLTDEERQKLIEQLQQGELDV